MYRRWLGILAVLLSLGVVSAQRQTLVVFAAASLTDAFEAISDAFEAENPDVEVLFNFGGSSTLATQLLQGAPADIFASANPEQMMIAFEGGRIAEPIRTFAKNRLVLIVPSDNPADIQSLRDLAESGVKIVLAAPEIPVRQYTDAMLERLAQHPDYGDAYRSAVVANIVSEEPNTRQVAAKIALGEADAGIVYASDVTPSISDAVLTVPIPHALNAIATYPIALTDDTPNPELAERFVNFVLSDVGQDLLTEWGFISVRIPSLPYTVRLPADGALLVDGQVLNPLTLSAQTLQADFAAHTVEARYHDGRQMVHTRFTGALLWEVIEAAQPHFNADVRNDRLSMFIVATGSDGYQAVISWGEIDPHSGNPSILIAYAENGKPIADELGGLRLVVPADNHDGRYVRGLVNISLRDAPPTEARGKDGGRL